MEKGCNNCKYRDLSFDNKPCIDCRMCSLYEPKENKEEKEEEISQDTVKILSNGYANEKCYIYAKCTYCFGEFKIREDLWTYNNTMSRCLTSKCPLCGNNELSTPLSGIVPPIVVARIEANSK